MKTTKKSVMNLSKGLIAAVLLTASFAQAEETAPAAGDLVVNKASSLDELLDNVEQRRVVESRENTSREQQFAREKANQAQLLKNAEEERRREERRSDRLETQFEENKNMVKVEKLSHDDIHKLLWDWNVQFPLTRT